MRDTRGFVDIVAIVVTRFSSRCLYFIIRCVLVIGIVSYEARVMNNVTRRMHNPDITVHSGVHSSSLRRWQISRGTQSRKSVYRP